MLNWINQNGGIVASVLLAVACFNVVMSAIQSLCNNLKIKEPSFLQKAGAFGAWIASWLSANVPSPVKPVDQSPPKNLPPQS